jgi:hypothetical protein
MSGREKKHKIIGGGGEEKTENGVIVYGGFFEGFLHTIIKPIKLKQHEY